MSLIDKIEELGAAVDAGLLDRATAAHQLVQYSDGGLTLYGAKESIDNWQTRRAAYADIFMNAELGVAAVQAGLRRGEQRATGAENPAGGFVLETTDEDLLDWLTSPSMGTSLATRFGGQQVAERIDGGARIIRLDLLRELGPDEDGSITEEDGRLAMWVGGSPYPIRVDA
ncbi:hypothetical protein BDK92_7232 [Micromonospora pisi]|uniref:Uncharacterized protein n=1 Tax=Micromonospora pisi TaxID=589240 RepID=A0A495JUS7_9ACTN|nr:hypothetical protein [Micromonospora pisi]RKR92753.1 hypothetical protein BDK92_7232 [Micromonospora pisi]